LQCVRLFDIIGRIQEVKGTKAMTALLGTRLGDFEIVRELGRGGMGIVYEARQVSLNRRVALKVLGGGLGLTAKAVQRFHREAEAAAKLHHTNIVPVYATGEENGTHFYAMELIDGPSIDHVIRQLRPVEQTDRVPSASLEATSAYVENATTSGEAAALTSSSLSSGSAYYDTVARMIAEVADALGYAHENGVIHRDLKPSNLLLSSAGRLSINDFGLARMLEQPGMTLTGEFVGTPMYMSPEQITAGRAPLDHRTDIYSLGATLYELLTLEPPFPAQRREQVIAQIIHKEPRPPRKVDKKVPVDLETICLKAMDKDPDRRYPNGPAMAADLRRYVNRFAISARRAGPWTRFKKWTKRHPGVAVLLGCLVVALLTAGFFASQAKRDRDQAQRAQDQLQAELRQAAVDKAILEAMSGDAPSALQAIADAENKGAAPGELNMLRGLVECDRGRAKEALVYLEQAEKQVSDSLAVKALLTKAYFDSGEIERGEDMAARLDQSQPTTAQDYLFLGLMRYDEDPARGLRTLEQMPAQARKSTVARLALARARTRLALMTGQVADAEKALEDVNKVDLPDDPLLLDTRIQALLELAKACGANDSRGASALKQATRDVARLARARFNVVALEARCHYYFVLGEDDALLRLLRQARSDNVLGFAGTDGLFQALVLYGRKDFKGAVRALETSPLANLGSIPLIERRLLMAAIPGRNNDARKDFNSAMHLARGTYQAYVAAYQQMLGPDYVAKCENESLEIKRHPAGPIPTMRDRWYYALLDYNAGLVTADELVKKAGTNRFDLCEGNFYIGLRKLGQGNRSAAKACFQRSLDTGVFIFFEYQCSRAFLGCIDDPTWLPWCPIKK
jgi:serine/threonine protein kinase